MKYFKERVPDPLLEEVYDKIGGRLTFLNRVAKAEDMIAKCDQLCELEKIWFLNNCAILGEEMDDDVMDQQKYAVSQAKFHYFVNRTDVTCPVHSHGPRQRPL